MVEWKTLGEVLTVHTGKQLNRSGLSEVGAYPVINGGRTPSGYTDIPNENQNTITISQGGESAGFVNWIDTAFWAGAHCFVVENCTNQNIRFLYHLLKNNEKKIMESKQGAGIPGLNRKNLYALLIPVPSLEEQERIVGILDTFTGSIENLKEQIAQRKKQYEFYRDQLLNLEGKPGVEMKTLGEIAKYRRGSFPQPYGNREWYDGEGAMPFVQVADVEEFGRKLKDKTKQFISTLAMPKSVYVPKGTVIVTLQGSIGKVAITQYDAYIDRTLGIFEGYIIDINKIFFALQLEKIFSIKREKARGGTIKTITKEEFTNFSIPVPPLAEQERIVAILDTFEASIKNLEEQLNERQKQYEYYREKLLTFE